jgi:hypothetical protein
MYKIGDRVIVHHWRGSYVGTVTDKLNELEYYVLDSSSGFSAYRTANMLELVA